MTWVRFAPSYQVLVPTISLHQALLEGSLRIGSYLLSGLQLALSQYLGRPKLAVMKGTFTLRLEKDASGNNVTPKCTA
jgi:hypothetical protein